MNIFNTFIFLFLVIHSTTTHCMISEFKYEPYTQILDQKIIQERNYITKWAEANTTTHVPKDIQIIGRAPQQTERCFDYALYRITGNYTSATIYTDKTSDISIEKYFHQIETPQPNDLLIYTISKDNREIKHFAIAIDETTFESRFGNCPYIIHHNKIFAVPTCYGNAASFWTLKKEFKTEQGRKKLIQELKNDINSFCSKEDFWNCQSITMMTLGVGWFLYCVFVIQT